MDWFEVQLFQLIQYAIHIQLRRGKQLNLKPPNDELEDPETVGLEMQKSLASR